MLVTFINPKGGAGKTTVTMLTAIYLALNGYKVLIKDFDPQAALSEIFLGEEALEEVEKRISEQLKKTPVGGTGKRLVWLQFEKELLPNVLQSIEDYVIQPTPISDILEGTIDLFPSFFTYFRDMIENTNILVDKAHLALLEMWKWFCRSTGRYDFIIFDVPPQPVQPVVAVFTTVHTLIPPVAYGQTMSAKTVKYLLQYALLGNTVVKTRHASGLRYPWIPGVLINFVTRRWVDANGNLYRTPFVQKVEVEVWEAVRRGLVAFRRGAGYSFAPDIRESYVTKEQISRLTARPILLECPIYQDKTLRHAFPSPARPKPFPRLEGVVKLLEGPDGDRFRYSLDNLLKHLNEAREVTTRWVV